jgi:adenylate cyclase
MYQERQLAAILFTDIVNSTAIMQKDEQVAMSLNKRYTSVLKQSVAAHNGKILNDYGDGSLCAFASTTQAVRCAMDIQRQLQTEPKVPLRVGLHVGEMFFEDGKVFGDGVNVASRIQSLGTANCILFSSEINNKLKNQKEFSTRSIGKYRFKNVDEQIEVFALCNEGFDLPDKKKMDGKLKERKSFTFVMILAALIVLLGTASFIVYRHYFPKSLFTGKEKSIAVLPFEAISSEKENEYINDGFTIDIIDKLSKLSGLTDVPGWARVKLYKNFKTNIIDIANELNVASILTGTIQKQGDKVRIIADLTDVNSGKTIWHTDEDSPWGDVLTIQNEVAEKIAGSLSAHLTEADQKDLNKKYTENAEAYNYYLKGRYFWDNRTPITFDSAEFNYKKAIELDPNYGLAYAGLADLYPYNMKGLLQTEAVPIGLDYVKKALSIDSLLVPALTTLGLIQSLYDYDWGKSKATLQKAIRLDPRYAWGHIFLGNLLIYTRENPNEGIAESRIAFNLDPLSPSINWIMGRNFYFAGEIDSAEKYLKKALVLNPKFSITMNWLARVFIEKKDFAQALDTINKIPLSGNITNFEYRSTILAYLYGISGNRKQALIEIEKLLNDKTFNAHYYIAMAYVGIKEFKAALDELEKSVRDKEIFLYFLYTDPVFSPLKNEPRFQKILKELHYI